MTIKVHEFKLLEEYKAEQTERAEKLAQYQRDVTTAKARLQELEKTYEDKFKESVKMGTDISAELSKVDDEISQQKELIYRKERDERLARAAMPDTKISSLEVVDNFRNEFSIKVNAEFVEKVEPKLQLARDLILSAIQDHREYSAAYDDVTQEVKEIVVANRHQGKTREIELQSHPTDTAKVMRKKGVTSAVKDVLEQVSKFTYGSVPDDYEYIEKAPTTTKINTKKGAN